ncbi:MAG: tRNA adenosine(34) deaminase TadA [Desulfobacteraceae bacterium]
MLNPEYLLNFTRNSKLETRNSFYMNKALSEARQALAAGEVPVGAILVGADGEIWGRAHNQPIGLADPTAHAEILALRQAAVRVGNYRLPGTSLYVTIEPCLMCIGAIIQARLTRLVFGAPDPKAGACISLYQIPTDLRLNHRLEVEGGIREPECRALMQEFFRQRRKAKNL